MLSLRQGGQKFSCNKIIGLGEVVKGPSNKKGGPFCWNDE